MKKKFTLKYSLALALSCYAVHSSFAEDILRNTTSYAKDGGRLKTLLKSHAANLHGSLPILATNNLKRPTAFVNVSGKVTDKAGRGFRR